MPRTKDPVAVKLVGRGLVCQVLSISTASFRSHYAKLFTPCRTAGGQIRVYVDEVEAAAKHGDFQRRVQAIHAVRFHANRLDS